MNNLRILFVCWFAENQIILQENLKREKTNV